jgi:branched-chain amino acid transport system ATP-binding protein
MTERTLVRDTALLDIQNLDAWYGRAQILFAVSLSVGAGEAAVLIGRNGAGKSTLMKSIMGLEAECRGTIRFDGIDLIAAPTHHIARAGIGYVPEDRRVFMDLTVAENLAVGRLPPRDGQTATWTPDAAFELFPPLAAMRDRKGGQMSGGEQQMLTIARALMGNPRFLLLDEPSEGLAPVIVEVIAGAIRTLKARGVGLLLSEQNLHFARAVADRAFVLDRGHIRFAGTLAALDADAALKEQYLSV